MNIFTSTEQAAYIRAVAAIQSSGFASTAVIKADNSEVSQNLAINLLDEMQKTGIIGEVQEDGTHSINP